MRELVHDAKPPANRPSWRPIGFVVASAILGLGLSGCQWMEGRSGPTFGRNYGPSDRVSADETPSRVAGAEPSLRYRDSNDDDRPDWGILP